MCEFKSLEGLFLEPIYSKDNHKQQASTSNPKAVASNIGLQLESTNVVANHPQVSKGVPSKAKFKLKQLKAIRWHKGAQTMSTLVIMPSSKDEDDYTIMGTIVQPIHEYNVGKLDTYVLGENWHAQKW